MDIAELNNMPLEFTLSGKVYKVKRLSITEIFSDFEKEIKQEYINDINLVAETMEAKDRIDFKRKAMQDIPRGAKLQDLVNEKMGTISGGIKLLHKALNKCQQVSLDECIAISENKNADTVGQIISYALGQDVRAEEVKDDQGKKK